MIAVGGDSRRMLCAALGLLSFFLSDFPFPAMSIYRTCERGCGCTATQRLSTSLGLIVPLLKVDSHPASKCNAVTSTCFLFPANVDELIADGLQHTIRAAQPMSRLRDAVNET